MLTFTGLELLGLALLWLGVAILVALALGRAADKRDREDPKP